MAASPDYLVVYGTLRPGFSNEYAQFLRQYSRYVGECSFPGLLYDLGNYPGAVYQKESAMCVLGSLYDISLNQQRILNRLDEYEGIDPGAEQPAEYYRTVIPVLCTGETLDCWVYLCNLSTTGKRLITSGDYLQYLMTNGNYRAN